MAALTAPGAMLALAGVEKFGRTLPVIAAPMFLVSGVELVAAACANGVIGSFPTANCRTPEQLDGWMTEIADRLGRA
ncbi:hypothetical protein, partial [Clostridium perfringens]